MKRQLVKLASKLPKSFGRTYTLAKQHSPELLLGVGLVGTVGSTILACKATLKADKVLKNSDDLLNIVKGQRDSFDESKYSEKQYRKDLTIVYTNRVLDLAKLYTPALLVGAASMTAILGSHNILRKRNVALVAAYKVLDEGFVKYRDRVIKDLGKDKDFEYMFGTKEETYEEEVIDEKTGKKRKVKHKRVGPGESSVYARFFDESCFNWNPNPEYNMLFLKSQQNYANDKLRARGHLFLNEVYEMIGLDHSSEGSVVGWRISKDKNSDNFVDFGIFDEVSSRFVNGYEPSILLDFNVDGLIYDLI